MLAVTVDWNLFSKYQGAMTPTTILLIAVVVAVSGWLVFQFKAWFRDGDGRADGNLEMLTQFRDLHRQGELSEDEYRLIKSRLAQSTSPSVTSKIGPQPSAKTAVQAVREIGGTEKTGETGQNDVVLYESRTSDGPPNLNSATQMQTGKEKSGMSPDEQG